MSIITPEKYKLMTGSTESDEKLSAIIAAVEKDYLRIRRKPFEQDEDGNVIYPVGSEITASQMVSYLLQILPGSVGLSSESIGDYAASFQTSDMLHGYPRSIITSIRRYGRGK